MRTVEHRLEQLVARCRDARIAVTPQRLAIYRELIASSDHPSPEMLFLRVRQSLPTTSLATIYKTLDLFEQLGLVDEVSPVGDVKRYDGNDRRHHHLVCMRCKRVDDFYDAELDALSLRRKLGGFTPESLTVQIKGLCATCARRSRT